MTISLPAQLSIWGGLLVGASGAAARANRPGNADDLLDVVAVAAARLGKDRWDRWSVFGPPSSADSRFGEWEGRTAGTSVRRIVLWPT
jgi:hypothetical protein